MQGIATLPTLYSNFQQSSIPLGRDPHVLPASLWFSLRKLWWSSKGGWRGLGEKSGWFSVLAVSANLQLPEAKNMAYQGEDGQRITERP